jgi:metal-dependent amidase/aminoacylase/carboxypeptidase family protein
MVPALLATLSACLDSIMLGVRNESLGITEMLHTPRFDVDEACLSVGVHAMSSLVLECLGSR